MNRYFDKPIMVMGADGKLATIRSVMDAAAFILESWPEEMNEEMLKPLEKFIHVIDEGSCPEDARTEFLMAIHQMTRLHS